MPVTSTNLGKTVNDMTQQEKEKMFLDLNSVLVKFWIEQGRPDKEIKIELLERMLNWYKKMGYVIPDGQSKEPINEDLEEAAKEYATTHLRNNEFPTADSAFIAGAEWQEKQDLKWAGEIHMNGYNLCKEQMLKDAVEAVVCKDHIVTEKPFYFYQSRLIELPDNLKDGDKVKIVVVPEKEDKK